MDWIESLLKLEISKKDDNAPKTRYGGVIFQNKSRMERFYLNVNGRKSINSEITAVVSNAA